MLRYDIRIEHTDEDGWAYAIYNGSDETLTSGISDSYANCLDMILTDLAIFTGANDAERAESDRRARDVEQSDSEYIQQRQRADRNDH